MAIALRWNLGGVNPEAILKTELLHALRKWMWQAQITFAVHIGLVFTSQPQPNSSDPKCIRNHLRIQADGGGGGTLRFVLINC